MASHLIKAAAGALALVAGLGAATGALATRNHYTHEQATDLGVAILQALDARDGEGRPARTPRYPSESFGRPPSAEPVDAFPDDDDDR